jgi:hypothetical protein
LLIIKWWEVADEEENVDVLVVLVFGMIILIIAFLMMKQ